MNCLCRSMDTVDENTKINSIPVITRVVEISNYNGMNDVNKKAYNILTTQGTDAAVKHMFNPSGERVLRYAEMRGMYG